MGLLCVSKLFPAFLFCFSWRGCGGWGGILGSHVFRTINNKVPFLNLEYTDVAVL